MSERWHLPRPSTTGTTLGPTLGILVALAYGIGGELFFQQNNFNDALMGTLSISFLILVPVGIGVLTVMLSPKGRRVSWPYAIFAPWAVCTMLGIAVMLLAMEAVICVAMGLPIFFVCSSVGGALVCWWNIRRARRRDSNLLTILLVVPLLASPLEAKWQPPTTVREINSSVVIDAPAAVVWKTFVTVPTIQPEEEQFAWFRAAGLPHPVEATLINPGPKGVRYASYDNGMQVVESVQVWELYARYRFGVRFDPTTGQHTPLWSDVATEHLQVQWVEYRIESLSDRQVRLHLTSRYRLETPINGYAAVWVDFLLEDFQHYILDIVSAHAEQHG